MKYLLYAHRFHVGVSDTARRCISSSVQELLAALTTPDPSTFILVSSPSIETFPCVSCQIILKLQSPTYEILLCCQCIQSPCKYPICQKEILISAYFVEYKMVSAVAFGILRQCIMVTFFSLLLHKAI